MRLRRCWRKRDETCREGKALTRRMLGKGGRNRSRIANESSLTGGRRDEGGASRCLRVRIHCCFGGENQRGIFVIPACVMRRDNLVYRLS